MNKSIAWLLGGIAGLATLVLIMPVVIGLLEIIAIVLPATLQFQETAVVIGVLATFVAAIFVSNGVTKWLARPAGAVDLRTAVMHLRAGIRPLRLVPDLVIMLALGAHYGLVTAMTTIEVGGVGSATMTIAVTNLFAMLVSFSIAGYLTVERRWTHLCALAMASWILGLLNVVFFGFTVTEWMGGSVLILVAMALGGSIATLLAGSSPLAHQPRLKAQDIEFDCEHCGERLAVAADLVGHRVACGSCGRASQAPDMPAAAVRERINA